MTAVIVVIVIVIIACLAAVGGVFVMTRRIRDSASKANEIIPGQPTNAPASWAGSHDPEALLHRRIRDALTLLRSDPELDHDGARIDARVRLEMAATELDNRLVATSKSPARLRESLITHADIAVTELEDLAATVVGGGQLPIDAVNSVVNEMSSPPQLES